MEFGQDRGGEPVKGYISAEPAVFRNADDRMEVAVADAARDTRVTYQQGTPSGTWTSEQDNWPSLDKFSVGDPAVAQSEDGTIAVFIRGADNRLYVKCQTTSGGAYWAAWTDHGGQLYSDPTVILHSDGTLHVFAIAASGGLAHLPQLVPNGTWGSWEDLGTDVSGAPLSHRPAAVLNSSGAIEVFARCHYTRAVERQVLH
ncbi:hypothetical protein NFX46_19910 [Streptomyces phaeoluteigriseus]|uniref:PLL-like beta propeller domain-containing protein n=1 Tax=Streptomyces phaeoluteigriseus TaxID=114686 RepID=A0ABY4ZBW3_9ACTN|nr:hypothetical protein [Streptomyces phaeoluteigriseus]USQ85812.1 hypothetical protein NFX46_19910 [Streptomyces phaeoluteigriseus]